LQSKDESLNVTFYMFRVERKYLKSIIDGMMELWMRLGIFPTIKQRLEKVGG